MDPVAQTLASIKAADLPAELYRTARELLDLAGDSGHVKISKLALMAICCTESDGTMRRQLGLLKKANLIHVSTNEYVYITFTAWPAVDQARAGRAQEITTRAPTRATRAPDAQPDAYEEPTPRAGRAPMITARAPTRARRALPHTRAVRSFVCSHPQQRENEQTNEHAPKPAPEPAETGGREPHSEQQIRAVALLTDPDVGLAAADAWRIAARFPLDEIARQVFEWRRQLQAGVVRHTGALLTRFERGFSAVIIPEDRRTALWQRHMPDADPEPESGAESLAQLAARYVSAGYELPAGPLQRPDPEPETGTPDHAWRQLAAELAQHLDGAVLKAHDSANNHFLAAAPGHKVEWLNLRLAPQASRKLTVITGRPAAVQFIAQGD